MSTFHENHKVQLTEEEVREAAEKLAKLTDDIEGKEADKKSVASQYKADIDRLTGDARASAALVRNKYEYRQVECREEFDYDHFTVSVMRLDTGETVRTRALTTAEKQAELSIG